MNTPTKIGSYAVGLVAVFGAAAGVGTAIGPVGPAAAEPAHNSGAASTATHNDAAGEGGDHAAAVAATDDIPGGLMVSQGGYTLALAKDDLAAGETTPTDFRILGPDGQVLTAYDESHDEELHLIAVRRDMSGFQHVHPQMTPDGNWSTPLALTAGDWRLFADFDPAGPDEAVTLGADVSVAGSYVPQPLPDASTTAEVGGYTVTLEGELVPGQEAELTLSISRDGQPVTDLQPYLAAYGHLVALRDGDLAYLHVHPGGEPGDGRTTPGPGITFYASVPSAGDYRLFLDFKHDGVVRTAEFTATAGDAMQEPVAEQAGEPHGHN